MKLFLFAALLVAVAYAVPLDGDKGETAPVADMDTAEFFHKGHKAKAHKGYSAPQHGYGAPKAAYGAPKAHKAPKAPKAAYGAPKAAYGAPPKAAYHAPQPAYHAPQPAYHAPQPAYHAPKAKGLKGLKAHKGGY